MATIKVAVRPAKTSEDGPVLARFPGGVVPPLDDTALEFLADVSGGGPRQQAHRRLVAAVSDQCQFVGENFGARASSKLDPCGYAVAVFDPAAKTLTVHPVQDTYTMDLRVAGAGGGAAAKDDSLAGLSNRSRRQLLINSFGSRKRRRDQKAQEASQINSTNIAGGVAVQALLKRTAKEKGASAKGGTSQERAIAENRRAFLPPFDAAATEKADVYKAADLLLGHAGSLDKRTRNFLRLLKDAAAFAEARQAPRKHDLGAFLIKAIEALHVGGGLPPPALKEKAQMMAMFSYLAKFHRLPHKMSGENLEEIANKFFIPTPLMKSFSELFTQADDSAQQLGGEGGQLRLSKHSRLKDKLIVWMFAVALHVVDKFTCTTKELAADLELPVAKVTQYFKLLGCATKSNQARLTAPPVFPRRSRGKK